MGESLRGLLLRWLVFPLVIASLLGTGLSHLTYQRPALEAYDRTLADLALVLAKNVNVVNGRTVLDLSADALNVLRSDRYDSIYLAVVGPEGLVVGDPLPLPPRGAITWEGRYFYDASFNEVPVRLAAMTVVLPDRQVTAIVAETTRKREGLFTQITLSVLSSQLLLVVASVLIVWHGVARGLSPLDTLRRELKARSHLDLRPLDESLVVEEVKPLVGEVNELLVRLDKAGRCQREFIANAAHQLRTPLAGLMTQLELAGSDADTAQRQTHIDNALEAARRTSHLVSQLLTLSAAEPEGRSRAEMASLDLAEVIRERMDAWVRQALAGDIDLGFELDSAPVMGDRLLLGEMIANLVDNALRYGRPGGCVTVHCLRRGDQAVLRVEDDGPGIPAELRHQALERFYRLPGSRSGGSGLGLAIVREVAERHGGSVHIDSVTDGQGAVVSVCLPLLTAA